MKHILRYICCWVFILSLTACSDKEYEYPPVKLEFLSVFADENGAMQTVVCDNGVEWNVIEDKSATKFVADSNTRVVANMEQLNNHQTIIHSLISVVCVTPLPADSEVFSEGIVSKPVEVVSIWQGISYINMVISVKTFNSKHLFHFVEEQYDVNQDGMATVRVLLYHNSDVEEAYNTKRAYASIPISHYLNDNSKQVQVYFDYYSEDGKRQENGPFIFKQ